MFLLDTNVFIAAFKSGWTKTTELLTSPEYELVGNSVLLEEYRRWAFRLIVEDPALQEPAMTLYSLLKNKIRIMEPDKEHLEACKPYFPESEKADLLPRRHLPEDRRHFDIKRQALRRDKAGQDHRGAEDERGHKENSGLRGRFICQASSHSVSVCLRAVLRPGLLKLGTGGVFL